MENQSPNRVEDLFNAAREREAGSERRAYLDGACGDDADLRSRVDALLDAHEAASQFLEGPAVERVSEGPGTSIGPYKLLQEIGEGGMGIVYMAEQEKPVRRKVALKVIKRGMDTKQVIARFEAERQALALMEHEHIARVLDAGSTDTGRPYFVMELVRGVPIDEYCDTHKLPTSERLALFVSVCRAVQHAHQKGIIHRDLKPTNVLVTSHDGTPVPKIIDFGVAKATNQRLTERTLFTEYHQVIGTPEYMSPEQAEMSGLDVDTRSDIYSLGVLLYQLLTGTTPVDAKELRTAAFEEMTRMIREDEPPAPSTRISTLGASAEKIAVYRASDAGSLSRDFRGDLDWIVMKALEKDRTRRYDTASAFAADVERHLDDRPVEAGPPGAGYRLAKFTRRNRTAVVAGLTLLAVVGLGLAGTTAGFLRARAEADRSGRVSDTLQDVLAVTDSATAASRQDLEEVLADVREVFGHDHATFASVLDTLSLRLHAAGDFEASADLSQESLEVWKRVYGDEHPNFALTLARLGTSHRAQGNDDQAEQALRSALAILDRGSDTPGVASYDTRMELADLLGNRGEYEEADTLLGEAIASLRASSSPEHFRILQTLERRALVQINQPGGDVRETVRAAYDETHEFYPDDSPMLAVAALGYGRVLFQDGEFERAETYLREAIDRFNACPQPRGYYFMLASEFLFQILRSQDDDPARVLEADVVLHDMIEVGQAFLGVDELAKLQKYYASRMADRGKYGEALMAAIKAFRGLVQANRPADDRDSLRGGVIELALKFALQPAGDPQTYAQARETLELALLDERDSEFVSVALGAILYRQGGYARAAETLDAVKDDLEGAPGQLAASADAFRAMAHARLGHEAVAREAQEALRAALEGSNNGENFRAILSEVEVVLESTFPTTSTTSAPSSEGD